MARFVKPNGTNFEGLGNFSQTRFGTYLNEVFDVATGMMSNPGGEPKLDVGLHCFSYAMVLANEFYFDGKSGADAMELKQQGRDSWPTSDWLSQSLHKVHIKGEDRVTKVHFVEFFSDKFKDELKLPIRARHEYTQETFVRLYEDYLAKVFDMAWDMMLRKPHRDDYLTDEGEGTLGGHCFRYAALLAGEFYFTPGVDKGGFHDSLDVTS